MLLVYGPGFRVLGKSAFQILPIVATPVSSCVRMCACLCITSLRKRMFPGRYNSDNNPYMELIISSRVAQDLFFSSLTFNFHVKMLAFY